jgi:hypothetical protein
MMTRHSWFGVALSAALVSFASIARATPSTQIWIPSTDVQKFSTLHLNYDVYARPKKTTILVLGPTVGVLPWQALQAEVGFDLVLQSSQQLDEHPLYLHGKLATPEDALFAWSPSVAVGIYNVGIKRGLTDQNLAYALVARTLPYVGRLSAGYYLGNEKVLVDEAGQEANRGWLASWDRTLTELSDKLWLAVDYQGGQSGLGALSAGAAWSFAPNVSLLAGYDHYLNDHVAGQDTCTLQLDITIEPLARSTN